MLIEPRRTLTVVTAHHARFYTPLLQGLRSAGVAVQPFNCGTAPAILYALIRLKKLAPGCSVAMFPCDHFVGDDWQFMLHVERAFRTVDARPEKTIVLGVEPDEPDPQYGWIQPGQMLANQSEPVRQVRSFWEKPPAAVARHLMWSGWLWSGFVVVARLSTFLGLFLIAMPDLYEAFRAVEPELGTPAETARLRRLYARIAASDFSDAVLAKCAFNLAVLQLSGVDFIELGESRLARVVGEDLSSPFQPSAFARKRPAQAGPQGSAGNL